MSFFTTRLISLPLQPEHNAHLRLLPDIQDSLYWSLGLRKLALPSSSVRVPPRAGLRAFDY